MAKRLDLVGQRFGYLVVIGRAENNNRGNTQWLCQCDCGKKKVVLGYDLTHGRTTTCGCKANMKGKESYNRKNLVGLKFGTLSVISVSKIENGSISYNCKCDCGKELVVTASNLRKGQLTHNDCPMRRSHNFQNLIGKRFGKLVVEEFAGKRNKAVLWKCKCECGNETIVTANDLRVGHTKSCGCLAHQREKRADKSKWLSNSRIYKEYRSMLRRCSAEYHSPENYYDRGIRVCDAWANEDGFENFKQWALENGYSDELTLDRINVNGNYSPDNCRWATNKEQQNNRRNNIYIKIGDEVKTLKQWSEHFGLDYGMVKARYKRGWSEDRLFIPPLR